MKYRITDIPGPVFTIKMDPPCTVKQLLAASKIPMPTHPTGYIQGKGGRVDLDYVVSKNELIVVIKRVYGD